MSINNNFLKKKNFFKFCTVFLIWNLANNFKYAYYFGISELYIRYFKKMSNCCIVSGSFCGNVKRLKHSSLLRLFDNAEGVIIIFLFTLYCSYVSYCCIITREANELLLQDNFKNFQKGTIQQRMTFVNVIALSHDWIIRAKNSSIIV